MSDPIYLDHNATTPIAPEVLEAMVPALHDAWGNPSSNHAYGRRSRQAVDGARGEVAALLGCAPEEIVFTSGGTESDNAAVLGVAEARAGHGRHLVISAIEHPAVERAAACLETRGWEVTRVPVDGAGRVEARRVAESLRDDTALVSIMHANNETGVVQPIAEIGEACRRAGVPLHTDAAQSVGKIATDVDALRVDLLTVAGHKLYGPKGVGALYIRRGTPCASTMLGAAHEAGRRAGTENVAPIVGLGVACRLAREELPHRTEHLRGLCGRLEGGLRREVADLVVHGADAERLPNTLCVAIPGHAALDVLERAPGVAASAGAACHSGVSHVSATLRAMGVSDELALATLRLSVGRPTTTDEIDEATRLLVAAVRCDHPVPPPA